MKQLLKLKDLELKEPIDINVVKDDSQYVVNLDGYDVYSYGNTLDEAMLNIEDNIYNLYLEFINSKDSDYSEEWLKCKYYVINNIK